VNKVTIQKEGSPEELRIQGAEVIVVGVGWGGSIGSLSKMKRASRNHWEEQSNRDVFSKKKLQIET